jgi:hypothetical protein
MREAKWRGACMALAVLLLVARSPAEALGVCNAYSPNSDKQHARAWQPSFSINQHQILPRARKGPSRPASCTRVKGLW